MDVERALVSSAISSTDGISELVSRGITPQIFSPTPAGNLCAEVYRFCIGYLRLYNQQPTLDTVKRHYEGWVNEFSPEPLAAMADEFLDDVRKRYFDAKVLELSRVTKDRDSWGQLDTIMLDAAREIASIIPSGRVARFRADMEQRREQYEIEANKGFRPGYNLNIPIIDETIGGVRPGWVVTTAGFSGTGKTTLALHAGLSVFESDEPVLVASLEMSADEVMEKLDTMVNNFRHYDLVRRKLGESELKRWNDVSKIYSKARGEITVVDKLGGCNIDRIHAEIARYQPKVVIIDYVQRMRGTRQSMAKWEGLEEITNELKTIAMDTNTAIIMVSQDGRDSAENGSTRTNMGNSISVYQAADLYIGLQQTDEMRSLGKMRVKLLKNRHGPIAEVDMSWKPATGEFGIWQDNMGFVKQPPAPGAI